MLLGHWGTHPGQNFIYAHLNRVIKAHDLDMIYVSGTCHGGPAVVGNTCLEGSYSEVYPDISRDEAGLKKLFRQFYEGLRSADIRKDMPNWNIWRGGCPGGEAPAAVSARADRLIASLCQLQGTVALFTHGQFGAALAARWIGLMLAFALLLLLVTLNWTAFAAPTALSLGFTEISAPLGLVMLVFTAVVGALFVVYIVFQQAGVILDARRFAKEGKVQRELADKAEASRFTELRTMLEGELRRIEAQGAASTRELGARMEQSERVLQDKLAEATRTTSAYLGEIEDKLDRVLAPVRS